jgi:TonB family protein
VEVVLDREGNFKDLRWLKSSGVAEFDTAVEETWRKLNRFPNPPQGILTAEGEVRMGWSFLVRVGEGPEIYFAPPARHY